MYIVHIIIPYSRTGLHTKNQYNGFVINDAASTDIE